MFALLRFLFTSFVLCLLNCPFWNMNVLFMSLPAVQATFRVFECLERRDSSNLSVTVSKEILESMTELQWSHVNESSFRLCTQMPIQNKWNKLLLDEGALLSLWILLLYILSNTDLPVWTQPGRNKRTMFLTVQKCTWSLKSALFWPNFD